MRPVMVVYIGMVVYYEYNSGSGVTANMPALGAGDSGFESRLPDRIFPHTYIHIRATLSAILPLMK